MSAAKPRGIPGLQAGEDVNELLEAISRWPARDAYEMQVKQMAEQWARKVVEENERLKAAHKLVRDAVCCQCGVSLPPDGDCYACALGDLHEYLKKYHAGVLQAFRANQKRG